jgi:hypothetical protein
LDVQASEIEDQQKRFGSEDEENNYYSKDGAGQTNWTKITGSRLIRI